VVSVRAHARRRADRTRSCDRSARRARRSAADDATTKRCACTLAEQLAVVAAHRGRSAEADRWRKEAIETAQRCGDSALADRIRAGTNPMHTGRHRKAILSSTSRSLPAPAMPATGPARTGG
jgi:hypothetical protein